jgi:general nucleoside transport system permease protein
LVEQGDAILARIRWLAIQLLPVGSALAVAVALATLIAFALGVSPGVLVDTLVSRFGPYSWGQVLFRATFLTFTGLAVAMAFQAGLFNIGAEGQAVVGSLACAVVGAGLAPLPPVILLPLAVAAAFAGGAAWGLLPGWLKARFGTHEVINTIMLNFIALAGSNFLMTRYLALPETVRTAEVGAALPRLDSLWPALRGSAVNASLLLALVAVLLAHAFLHHTAAGFKLRAVGRGLVQARTAGIEPGPRIVAAFALAGGAAGLVGTNFVLGYKHYYEDGFTGGIGFLGIAVALVARNEPLAVFPAALLFGLLSEGGLVVNTLLPREMVDVLTGAILLAFIVAERVRLRALRGVAA